MLTEKNLKTTLKNFTERISQDFHASELKHFEIVKDYENSKNQTISIRFKISQNLTIQLVCFQNHPFEKPRAYFVQPVKLAIVNPTTSEINYESFYSWKENSSTAELAVIIKNYFLQIPFLLDENLIEMHACKDSVIKIMNDHLNEGLITIIEKATKIEKDKPKINLAYLKQFNARFSEIETKLTKMCDYGNQLLQEIDDEILYLESVKESSIKEIIDAKFSKMNIIDLGKNYRSEIRVILTEIHAQKRWHDGRTRIRRSKQKSL